MHTWTFFTPRGCFTYHAKRLSEAYKLFEGQHPHLPIINVQGS